MKLSMNVEIRPLRYEDISQVTEIERQAFPTLWPPTPFKRELENHRAKYLIAREPRFEESGPPEDGQLEQSGPSEASFLGRFVDSLKKPFSAQNLQVKPDYSVLGFVGLWFTADEAHITAIAVENASRGKGVGELLLMGSIEVAMARNASAVSLEARVSNRVAQSLYEKYGFHKMGIRKAYYTDDREDAVIMTTQPIYSPHYHERFLALREAYTQRHGNIRMVLA